MHLNAYDNSSKLDFNGGNNIIDWADKKYYDVMKRIDLVTAASRIKLKAKFFLKFEIFNIKYGY